ncbi:hypothetical protein CKO15_04920 [Halorhodospira abdelmalekii]|uniref:hypothetical protein n=1 Tax=Halorhodospira abdelmalekii TaxID=421629 RepID=UPI001907B417|nr:hypothetical protein [Halorhodospira abdelmalekii]MBK1734638.1 hypothetical protein [Halorhodospira abdelmalekii]
MRRQTKVLTATTAVALSVALSIASFGVAADERSQSYPFWSYDIGVGSGYSSAEGSFAEGQAALNTHFTSWLNWRNAGFYRSYSDRDNFYGLDTSLLAGGGTRLNDQVGIAFEAGGGYRFTSVREHAPFAEAALRGSVGDVRVRANVKYLFYEAVGDERENEVIFSVSVSGRTAGRF